MTLDQAIELALRELQHAEEKHPGWPLSRLRQVAIMVEEAGEALQAALTIIETEEKLVRTTRTTGYEVTLDYNNMAALEDKLEREVAQTAAMALRWLVNRKPLYSNGS